jgi:hypothetical protein
MEKSRKIRIVGIVAAVAGVSVFALLRPSSIMDWAMIVLAIAIGLTWLMLSLLVPMAKAQASLVRKLAFSMSISTTCILGGGLLLGRAALTGTSLIILGVLLKRFLVSPMLKRARNAG